MSAVEDAAALSIDAAGRQVTITTPGRVLWPDIGFTKRDLAAYYVEVAEVLVPHLADRPVTLKRAPEGTTRPWWYQTECPSVAPWARTVPVPAAKGERVWNYCVVDDDATLLWLVNLGCIEFHPLLVRCGDLAAPTSVVFDLDPGPDVGLVECCEVALTLRRHLDGCGLTSFVKTSGGVGMHVVVPLSPPTTFDETRSFARGIAEQLVAETSGRVTDRMARGDRGGRVFVDWQQNGAYKSIPAPYSVRLMGVPLVSVPLRWEEVENAGDAGEAALLFVPSRALQRLSGGGDPWADLWHTDQRLS
ncbi:MAG TPA: non-homologous end-joining DNA ligase [Actinomycetota bacterium]|nr:non-homologous end-joining DNA ligase [Actinomycetota bacterium]